jgi:hypothetical protein
LQDLRGKPLAKGLLGSEAEDGCGAYGRWMRHENLNALAGTNYSENRLSTK